MDEEKEEELKFQEYHNKRVAYFDSWVKSWIQNRTEIDRQLLTLSALAIGLLVGAFGEPANKCQFWIWVGAGFSFILCICLLIWTFHQNSIYIEIVLKEFEAKGEAKTILNEQEQEKTRQLNKYTKIAFILFLVGVALTFILVVIR